MKILELIGWARAVEAIAIFQLLEEHGKTIDDLKAEIAEQGAIQREAEDAEFNDYVDGRRVLKEKGINTDWCDKCDMPLIAVEGIREECETELKCPTCERSDCIDLSVADYNLAINNKLNPPPDEDMLIEPGEYSVAMKERMRRREICHSCPYLNGKTCKRCGCSIKHRTYYEILRCPEKRW